MNVSLIPFLASSTRPTASAAAAGSPPNGLGLAVEVHRRDDRLRLHYRLRDPRALVLLAPPAASRSRRDGLWNHTCLEAFLAVPDQESYREFNLAPSGDWNVYQLQRYRSELHPDPAFEALPFHVERHTTGLDLRLEIDLGSFLPPGCPLELGLTAVLELQSSEVQGRELQYWALAHTGPVADFHRRDSFLLRL